MTKIEKKLGADFLKNEVTPRYLQKKLRVCREEAERKAYIYALMNKEKVK